MSLIRSKCFLLQLAGTSTCTISIFCLAVTWSYRKPPRSFSGRFRSCIGMLSSRFSWKTCDEFRQIFENWRNFAKQYRAYLWLISFGFNNFNFFIFFKILGANLGNKIETVFKAFELNNEKISFKILFYG